MTDSVTAAFADRPELVRRLCEQAVAAYYDRPADRTAAEATALVWSLAGELTGGDILARRQIYGAVLAWGIRQVPAGIEEVLASAPGAPLCDTVATLVATHASAPSDPGQWILARDQACVLAVDPDAAVAVAGEALLFGALARARRRVLAEGGFPRHCELVLWLAAAIYRSRDARWTAMELGSGNGWVLTDHRDRVEGPGSPGRRTYHFDLAGAQEYVLTERHATRGRVLAALRAAGQNLEPVTGAFLRYLIAVDIDTRTGIFFVPGEFSEVEYKACAFEALGTGLEPTLHVHSDSRVFHAADVVWHPVAPHDSYHPDAEPGTGNR